MEVFSINKLSPVTPEWWDLNICKKQKKWQLE